MVLKDARRDHVGHRALEAGGDGFGLAGVGHAQEDALGLADLADRHRDRLLGHIVEGCKPAFTKLLLAACFVEVNHEVGRFGVEVRGRIIERKVGVFTDPGKTDINRVLFDQRVETEALRFRIFITGHIVERAHRAVELAMETFPEVATERRRMGDRQADVFIEVKTGDFLPWEIFLDQRLEHFKLGSASGNDDVGVSVLFDRFADQTRAVDGSRFPGNDLIRTDFSFNGHKEFLGSNRLVPKGYFFTSLFFPEKTDRNNDTLKKGLALLSSSAGKHDERRQKKGIVT